MYKETVKELTDTNKRALETAKERRAKRNAKRAKQLRGNK